VGLNLQGPEVSDLLPADLHGPSFIREKMFHKNVLRVLQVAQKQKAAALE